MDVYQMVYDRKYKELLQYIVDDMNFRKLSRVELYVMKLLNSYFRVVNGGKVTPNKEYSCNERDYFRRVFDSMKQYDYVHTRECLLETIDRANDPEEFQIYLYIVEDILYEIDKSNVKKNIEKLDKVIKNDLFSIRELSDEDYYRLRELYEKRYSMEEEYGLNTWYSKVSMNILDMIQLVKEKHITKTYFEKLGKGSNKEEEVIDSLNVGDYPNAYRLLHNIDYRTCLPNLEYYYMVQIKNLLVLFNKSLFVDENKVYLNELSSNIVTYLYFDICNRDINGLMKLLRNKDRVYKIISDLCSDNMVLKKV